MASKKKVHMTLVGLNGNAFSLLHHFITNARKQEWTEDEIKIVTDEAKSSDYEHLIATLDANIDDAYDEYEEEDDD